VNGGRIGPRLAGQMAATTPMPPRTDADREATSGALRLAILLEIERTWTSDREAMLAALRVILGLPRVPRSDDGDER
jgi:hypothetical protein